MRHLWLRRLIYLLVGHTWEYPKGEKLWSWPEGWPTPWVEEEE